MLDTEILIDFAVRVEVVHIPVMPKEVVSYLDPKPGGVYVDATIGCGGHAKEILAKIRPSGQLIGIDQDQEAIEHSRRNLKEYRENLFLVNDNFRNLAAILADLKVDKIDGILFDLGVSSLQLDGTHRGFSIKHEAPLDMRMDKRSKLSALELVNKASEEELSQILRVYGEERFHNRIARLITQQRRKKPIMTTTQLSELVTRAQGPHKFYKIHPATRTFQALRIAVNNELSSFETALKAAVGFLKTGGRLCVLSYHSLEDRIAKNIIRDFERQGVLRRLAKKPITPSQTELSHNPRSRSAKLRAAQKVQE